MFLRPTSRVKLSALLLAALVALSACVTLAEDVEIPKEDEKALKAAVQGLIDELWEKKEDGLNVHRGTCSMAFRPAGDGQYRVEFYEDHIIEEKLQRTRYMLTLEKDGREFKVSKKEELDAFPPLPRYVPGKEKPYRFDSMEFDREGMKVSGGPGSLALFSRGGEMYYMLFAAEDLSYDYEPPKDLDHYARHRVIRAEKERDFIFEPELGSVLCSPDMCQEFLDKIFQNAREASRADLSEIIVDELDDFADDIRDAREDNNFGGFSFPADRENVYYRIGVKKENRDHWAWLEYDNWDPKECGFGVTGYWPVLYRYYSEETRAQNLDPHILEMRPDEEARRFDVVTIDGTVEMALQDSENMAGDVTYTIRVHEDLDWLDFRVTPSLRRQDAKEAAKQPNLKVDFFRDENDNELFWIQTGGNTGRVILPRVYKAGEIIKLRMKFQNRGCIYDYSASYSYVDRGGWLPFVRFGDLIDDMKLTVKVPAKFKTLGIDKKVSERVEGDVNITRWESTHPVSFPTIIYGDYYQVESETVAKKLDGTKIPVNLYFDRHSMGRDQITPKLLKPLVEQAAQAINLYSRVYGVDYPFTKLDLVNDPIGGFLYGQAPASIIYLANADFRGAGLLASALDEMGSKGDLSSISRFLKTVVAHETGHQWWGSSTANKNQSNYWFIESLAEYSSALYQEFGEGREAYLNQVEEWKRTVLEAQLMYPIQSGYTEWAGDFRRGGTQAAIYNQGPLAFHILRETFGDEKFFRFLRILAQSTAGKRIVTRDIQKVAEYAFGGSMDWFFDQWIRGYGLPEYHWDLRSRQTEDGQYLIEGEIVQSVVLGKDQQVLEDTYFRGAIPVHIEYADGTREEIPLLVEGEKTQVQLKVKKEPSKIGFNAENEILTVSLGSGDSY